MPNDERMELVEETGIAGQAVVKHPLYVAIRLTLLEDPQSF